MMNGKEIDLYTLYEEVKRAGGYSVMLQKRMWKALASRVFGVPASSTNAGYTLRMLYQRTLLPYELKYRVTSADLSPAPPAASLPPSVSPGAPGSVDPAQDASTDPTDACGAFAGGRGAPGAGRSVVETLGATRIFIPGVGAGPGARHHGAQAQADAREARRRAPTPRQRLTTFHRTLIPTQQNTRMTYRHYFEVSALRLYAALQSGIELQTAWALRTLLVKSFNGEFALEHAPGVLPLLLTRVAHFHPCASSSEAEPGCPPVAKRPRNTVDENKGGGKDEEKEEEDEEMKDKSEEKNKDRNNDKDKDKEEKEDDEKDEKEDDEEEEDDEIEEILDDLFASGSPRTTVLVTMLNLSHLIPNARNMAASALLVEYMYHGLCTALTRRGEHAQLVAGGTESWRLHLDMACSVAPWLQLAGAVTVLPPCVRDGLLPLLAGPAYLFSGDDATVCAAARVLAQLALVPGNEPAFRELLEHGKGADGTPFVATLPRRIAHIFVMGNAVQQQSALTLLDRLSRMSPAFSAGAAQEPLIFRRLVAVVIEVAGMSPTVEQLAVFQEVVERGKAAAAVIRNMILNGAFTDVQYMFAYESFFACLAASDSPLAQNASTVIAALVTVSDSLVS